MPTTFTGSDSFPDAISGPSPGEDVTAASVVDGDTLLADRTIWLANRIAGIGVLVDRATFAASSTSDAGPINIQDLKGAVTWTDVAGVDVTSTEEVAEGDIVNARFLIHTRCKRGDAGFTLFRVVLTYDIDGVATDITVQPRRCIGTSDPAGCDLHYLPVDIEIDRGIAADASGTVKARLQAMLTVDGAGGDELHAASPWAATIRILRKVPDPS